MRGTGLHYIIKQKAISFTLNATAIRLAFQGKFPD